MKALPQKRDLLELTIHDLAFGARGLARQDDFVWFIDRGIPGQRVKARVKRVRKRYGEARIEEVLTPSPHQVDPPCPHFGTCGGCQLQHLAYDIQVQAKTQQVQDILERIGGLKNVSVNPTIPAQTIYGYRNKMEFSFSARRWIPEGEPPDQPRDFALGLHVPGRYDKVLDIHTCLLQSETCNGILRDVRRLARESGLKPYDEKTHTGFWRFLVLREGKNTGEIMLNLVTSGQESDRGTQAVDRIGRELLRLHPCITTLLHSTTDRKAQVAFGESERIIHGPGKIREKIGDRVFQISPNAFFQTNTHQAQCLFETLADLARFRGDETVYDLYCGTGAIGIVVAHRVGQVVGIEVIPSAIEDARLNARLNQIANMAFVTADMKNALEDADALTEKFGAPDTVILDPPRGGTHPKTVAHLLKLAAPKIVYVSCNPTVLARDLQTLCETTYTLQAVQPVDMFPHTGHIEVVLLLVKYN